MNKQIENMSKIILFISLFYFTSVNAQTSYDSITIGRCSIEQNWYNANWPDSLKTGTYTKYIHNEKTIYTNAVKRSKVIPQIISLTKRIKANGTGEVSKCFIPRHSINYYKGGLIIKYMLICFECDEVKFSDDPKKTFVKNVWTREKQMNELKAIFKKLGL